MPSNGNIVGEKQAFRQFAVVADTRDKRVEALKQSLDGSAAIQAIDCAPAKLSLDACKVCGLKSAPRRNTIPPADQSLRRFINVFIPKRTYVRESVKMNRKRKNAKLFLLLFFPRFLKKARGGAGGGAPAER